LEILKMDEESDGFEMLRNRGGGWGIYLVGNVG
jgi:hypothetical protein